MKKVLVVDDSKFWRLLLYDHLKENYEVLLASSGVEGIKKAFEFYPDVIISDYNMPDISGIVLSIVLRNYEEFKDSGIFILTSSDDKLNDFWVKKSGANKFFSKLIFKEKEQLDKFFSLISDRKFKTIKNFKHEFSNERIYEIVEEKLQKEIYEKEILNLLKYIRDEQYLMYMLHNFLKNFLDFESLLILLISESEGRIYSFGSNVSRNHAKALLLSYFEKPIIPNSWNFKGDFDDSSKKRIKDFEKIVIEYEGKEEGILLFEKMQGSLTGIESLILESLGIIFSTLNNFKEYMNASMFDGLTGLYNKKTLFSKIESFIEKYGKNTTIAMLDIDNFKSVNDTYGHVVGDVVLKKIAEIIKEQVNDNSVAGRYGGEEFIVLFDNCENAILTVRRIFEKIHETNWENILNDKKDITVSCGISTYKDSQTVTEFINAADNLLYKAKMDGKDRFYFENEFVDNLI